MTPANIEHRCERLALLVAHAHQLIAAGRVGRGLDLLEWAGAQRQTHCIGRRRVGGRHYANR